MASSSGPRGRRRARVGAACARSPTYSMSKRSSANVTGYGTRTSACPQHAHHVVLVVGPALLQERLAVGGHALDRPAVAALAELAALPVGDVVAELRRALHAHRLEHALLGDLAREVELAGQQAPPGGAGALDERHLSLLAGLQHAEVGVGVRLGDEPVGWIGVVGHVSSGVRDDQGADPGSTNPRREPTGAGATARRGRDREMRERDVQSWPRTSLGRRCRTAPVRRIQRTTDRLALSSEIRAASGRTPSPPVDFGDRQRDLTRCRSASTWLDAHGKDSPAALLCATLLVIRHGD